MTHVLFDPWWNLIDSYTYDYIDNSKQNIYRAVTPYGQNTSTHPTIGCLKTSVIDFR